jgi:CRP-like cAMP-binding protein
MSWFQVFLRQESTTYRKGDVIFARGDAAASMFVVAEGEVDLSIGDHHLETLGPAGIFGEMALIDGEPRSGTARARTDCRLIEIPEKRFTFLVQQTPGFALNVMRILATRLRRRDPVG